MHNDSLKAWSHYWIEEKQLWSCPGTQEFDKNGTLRRFWESQLLASGRTQKILDVACGNGVIGKMFFDAAIARGLTVDIVGIDVALIREETLSHQESRLQLMGSIAVESTPFEDGSFDKITSQYGIECSDLSTSTLELARLLAPGGRMVFLTHSCDSIIYKSVCAQQLAYQQIQAENLFGLAMEFLKRDFTGGDARSVLKQIHKSFSLLLKSEEADMLTLESFLRRLDQLLASRAKGSRAVVESEVNYLFKLADIATARASSMRNATEKVSRADEFKVLCTSSGLQLQYYEPLINEAEINLGTVWEFTKP